MWDETTTLLTGSRWKPKVKHLGAYWALLAGIVPEEASTFYRSSGGSCEFNRLTGSGAFDSRLCGTGNYWCGGV
jgi:hypothetical protein